MQTGAAATGKQDGSSSKTINRMPNYLVTPLLGIDPKEFKAETQADICLYKHVHNSSIPNRQRRKQPKCP